MNLSRYRRAVFALATGGLLALVIIVLATRPTRAAGPWYVAPGGGDGNDCLSPGAPCATINGALGKASPGDTVYVAVGTYTGCGTKEVVLLDKDATLSGGWDAGFTAQSGMSTIDGQGSCGGMSVTSGVTALVERFTLQNGSRFDFNNYSGGGIGNGGSLTLDDCTLRDNHARLYGGGIDNSGTLIINDSTISGNTADGYYGGGIHSDGGSVTLDHSTVSGNAGVSGGGIYSISGEVTVSHSTVAGNTASATGGGIRNSTDSTLTLSNSAVTGNVARDGGGLSNASGSTLTLSNCTISGNTASGYSNPGGGIVNLGTLTLDSCTITGNTAGSGGGISGSGTLQNTILAGNTAVSGPDCSDALTSSGYNLVGNTADCTFTASPGDLTNVDPKLGPLIGTPGYHPLVPDSPAIDAIPPTQCTVATDQRGVTRPQGSGCDMGAYEHTTPGPADSVVAIGGTPGRTAPLAAFPADLEAMVLDSIGTPVMGATVTFIAPESGVSGTFGDSGTYTTDAVTEETGIATAATFTANGLEGSYVVTATASGVLTPTNFLLTNIQWYVSPGGDDGDDCLSPATSCAGINGALAKPGFVSGDWIVVASGTYTGTGDEVVLLDKDTTLSGGWDETFTIQSGTSTIDGEGMRRGMTVNSGIAAAVECLTLQNGSLDFGGGIHNEGNLGVDSSTVSGNTATYSGGGIYNGGTLALNNCAVSGNTVNLQGGGIYNDYGAVLTLSNSTVSDNSTNSDQGGGIYNHGTLTLYNSTVSGNTANSEGGGIYRWDGTVVLKNTILAGNTTSGAGPDCSGTIGSSGYNLIGDVSGCDFTLGAGDLTDMDPNLGLLIGSPAYYPLLSSSPAIDIVPLSQCTLATDQRGVARPQGPACDIGAYEYMIPGPPDSISAFTGTPQRTLFFQTFGMPLQALVMDNNGSPVNSAVVTFSAPASGASGTFADSGSFTTTAMTGENGVATAATFTANGLAGSYVVQATVGGVVTPASFLLSNIETRYVYLPCIMRNHHYCADFFDDFSNPASGWAVMDDSYVRTEYLNGEYRVLTKQSGYFYLFRAPTCNRQNYTVEVDTRWVGTPGSSYGLLFGLASDYSQYYLFDMNTDNKLFRLLRRDPAGFVIVVPVTDAPAINGGTASNHIKVTRYGTGITLEVNGTVLGTWYDGAIGGLTGAGLVTNPYYDLPISDARFDNFAVVSLSGEGAPVGESGSVTPEGIEFVAPNARRDRVPRVMGW